MSGFIPTVEGYEIDLDPPFPRIAVVHGVLDPVISVDWGREARDTLEESGADVVYRESQVGHGIDPDVIPLLRGVVAG
jgi:predicted esterase